MGNNCSNSEFTIHSLHWGHVQASGVSGGMWSMSRLLSIDAEGWVPLEFHAGQARVSDPPQEEKDSPPPITSLHPPIPVLM